MAFGDGPSLVQISKVIIAVVAICTGTSPALTSRAESCMDKQAAWAAATSSSGLVPIPLSKRAPNEYCVLDSTPLSIETLPFPSLRLPFHSAEAFLFI